MKTVNKQVLNLSDLKKQINESDFIFTAFNFLSGNYSMYNWEIEPEGFDFFRIYSTIDNSNLKIVVGFSENSNNNLISFISKIELKTKLELLFN